MGQVRNESQNYSREIKGSQITQQSNTISDAYCLEKYTSGKADANRQQHS